MTPSDPRETIARAPMSRAQILAVAICVALNALDGFDVLAITFAAPGLKEAWGLDAGAVGWLISAGLIGMTAGSLLIAPVADVVGRRRTILGCLAVMAAGMLASALARDFQTLFLLRLFTGLGIGGLIPAINAMAAEYSNARNRDLAVSLMAVGYPIGGVLGGSAAVWLLSHHEWPSVFWFGAGISALMLPLVFAALPESIEFLMARRPADALARVNATLRRIGHAALERLPDAGPRAARGRLSDIFSRGLMVQTLLVTAAYFFHMVTFYYVLGWAPSIVAELGFGKAEASSVSVLVSVGGILGGVGLGLAARFVTLRVLVAGSMAATVVSLAAFGLIAPTLPMLYGAGFAVGLFVFNGAVGLYAFMARVFPPHVRSTGAGFAIGVGRAGGTLGPILAGLLMAGGADRPAVAIAMAAGSAVAAVSVWMLRETRT